MHDKPKIPRWMFCLPDGAIIGSKEISQIYGIRCDMVTWHMDRGTFPKHDFMINKSGQPTYRWLLGTIRKAIKESEAKNG